MEENTQKFLERMNELVVLGKKKKSILDVQEINDFFADMELTTEQMEKVFDYLETNNIDVLRISGDADDEAGIDIDDIISDEEEVDMVCTRGCEYRRSGPYVFKRDRESPPSERRTRDRAGETYGRGR